ncbi:hypothetical protein Tco_0850802 [Tanacetum coccineum]
MDVNVRHPQKHHGDLVILDSGTGCLALLCSPVAFPAAVAGLVCHECGSVHIHDHDGSEDPDKSLYLILSSEPKPLRKHRPPPPPSILSPRESSYPP